MEHINVKIKLVRPGASLPSKATSGSAAYDICVWPDAPVTIGVGEIVSLPTGIAMEPDREDVAALMLGRSGLGAKHGITLANCVGLIDSDYRGEMRVTLINRGSAPFVVNPGDRVAQLMFVPVFAAALTLADELGDTERGAGGFGSTGI